MPRFSRIEVEEILAQAKKLGKERFEDQIAPNQPQVPTLSVHAQMVVLVCQQNAVKATDLSGFEIWRNTVATSATATKIGFTSCAPTQDYVTWPDATVAASTTYYYWIKAVDVAGNASVFSEVSSAAVIPAMSGEETVAPTAPTDLVVASVAWTQSDGTLISRLSGTFTPGERTMYTEVWYAEGATPEETDYRLYGLTSVAKFAISALKPSTEYSIMLIARNSGGPSPSATTTHTTATKDLPPAAPTGLAAVQQVQNRAILDLSWNRVDEPDVRGYKVRKGGTEWADATVVFAGTPEPIFPDNRISITLTESGTETWRVAAVDRVGNESAATSLTFEHRVEPNDITGLSATQDTSNRTVLRISWADPGEKDIKRYEIRTGGSNWDNATIPAGGEKVANLETSIVLSVEGPLTIRVKAINRAGFYSQHDGTYIANINLTPSDVTGFQALQNGDNILMSWETVPDLDILGYRIVEGPSFALGATIAECDPSKTQVEVPVSSERDYLVRIKAINRAGFLSMNDASATVTIMNLTPRNVVESFDELVLQSGTHTNTEFGASQYTMANLPGRMSDYPTLRMDAAGSANVLRLVSGNTSGSYVCVQKDMGSIITAHIAVDWFILAIASTGQSARLEFRTSLNGTLWTDWLIFSPATQTFRYLEFRAILASTDPTKTPEVTIFTISVDVPDKELIFRDHSILAAGTEINYGHTYNEIPSVVPAALGNNLQGILVEKSTTKCTIKIWNFSTSAYVDGTADIRVRGY